MGVIYIGLGGTGLKVLERLKKNLSYFLNVPNPNVAFIGIDVGNADCPPNLAMDLVNLTGGSVNATVNSAHFNNISDWWFSKNYQPPFEYRKGAYQFRILGRLALYLYANMILSKLRDKITQLGSNNIDFVIVASISGGVGAGIFRDMPGIIKDCMGSANHNVYGLLISHDVVNQCYGLNPQEQVRSKSNALSLLEEIDKAVVGLGSQEDFQLWGPPVRRVKMMVPYKNVFLIYLNNMAGKCMDTKEDYFELAALALENIYHISGQYSAMGPSFSGVENTMGPLLVKPTMSIPITIQGQLWMSPFKVGKIYSSFATAIIEFPEDEAKDYLTQKFMDHLLKKALSTHQDENTKRAIIDPMILPFVESRNQDRLVQKAYEIYRAKAKENKCFLLQNARESLKKLIEDQIYEVAKDNGAPTDLINTIKSQMKFYAAGIMFELLDAFFNQTQMAFSQGLERIYTDQNLSLRDRADVLADLKTRVEYEFEDFKNEEVVWLKNNPLDQIERKIEGEIENICKLNDEGLLNKFFIKKSIEARKKTSCSELATLLVDSYEKYLIYQNALSIKVPNFFTSLINLLNDKNVKMIQAIDSVQGVASSIRFTYPTKLEAVGVGRGKIDFRVRIAHSRDILDEKLVQPTLATLIRVYPKDIGQFVAEFTAVANDAAQSILANFTLDQALDWESEYFWEKMDLNVAIDGRDHRFSGLANAIQKVSNKQWQHLAHKYGEFYDPACLVNLRNSNVTSKAIAVCQLMEGRIKLSLDSWKDEFFSVISPLSPPIANGQPQNYVSYIINVGDGGVPINEKVNGLMSSYAVGRWGAHKTPTQGASRTRVVFVNFSLGAALMAINSFVIPATDVKSEKIRTTKDYMRSAAFIDPDTSGIYLADKRFLENSELISHSALIEINASEEEFLLPFKTILLLLTSNKLGLNGSTFSVQENISTETHIVFHKGKELGGLNEIYRILFLYYMNELPEILEIAVKNIQGDPNKIKLLDDGYRKLESHPDFRMAAGASIPILLKDFVKKL
jgi:hypothetical protein